MSVRGRQEAERRNRENATMEERMAWAIVDGGIPLSEDKGREVIESLGLVLEKGEQRLDDVGGETVRPWFILWRNGREMKKEWAMPVLSAGSVSECARKLIRRKMRNADRKARIADAVIVLKAAGTRR